MNKKIFLLINLLLVLLFSISINTAFACINGEKDGNFECVNGVWVKIKGTTKTTQTVTLPNPLGSKAEDADINVLIGKIINAVLGIVGSLALVMFIYGGFTWMLAAGSPERVKRGKDIIIWAAIGLIIIFSAYALVKFVFTGLGAG
jgi:hypothetical protein